MRKNDRSLINVLESKVSVFFSKFFSPPFIPPLCSRRVEKSLVWLAWPLEAAANMVQRSRILPTHGISPFTNRTAFVSFLPYLPLLSFQNFLRSVASRNLFHFISLPFVEKYRRGNYSENIARNNRGNIRSEVFLFLATVEKSYSLV